MANPYNAPEISVQEAAQKLKSGEDVILMDVREPHELLRAKLPDEWVTSVPLSRLARELLDGLPENVRQKDAKIIVMCHTGVRSAQVTAWLRQQGWTDVWSLAGGIDAWARHIDPKVGFY